MDRQTEIDAQNDSESIGKINDGSISNRVEVRLHKPKLNVPMYRKRRRIEKQRKVYCSTKSVKLLIPISFFFTLPLICEQLCVLLAFCSSFIFNP